MDEGNFNLEKNTISMGWTISLKLPEVVHLAEDRVVYAVANLFNCAEFVVLRQERRRPYRGRKRK